MFYIMYLSSVCQRRQWPDPYYEPYSNSNGYLCKVRVNNREYCTEVPYQSEALARDGAAMKAFMICRNFSQNDGMYPGQRPGQRSSNGFTQGLPVAIGTGRRSNRGSGASYDSTLPDTISSDGTSSGGNSPKSIESGFEQQMRQVTQQLPKPTARKQHRVEEYYCLCRRGAVQLTVGAVGASGRAAGLETHP